MLLIMIFWDQFGCFRAPARGYKSQMSTLRVLLGYKGYLAQDNPSHMDALAVAIFSQVKLAMWIVASFVCLHVWQRWFKK